LNLARFAQRPDLVTANVLTIAAERGLIAPAPTTNRGGIPVSEDWPPRVSMFVANDDTAGGCSSRLAKLLHLNADEMHSFDDGPVKAGSQQGGGRGQKSEYPEEHNEEDDEEQTYGAGETDTEHEDEHGMEARAKGAGYGSGGTGERHSWDHDSLPTRTGWQAGGKGVKGEYPTPAQNVYRVPHYLGAAAPSTYIGNGSGYGGGLVINEGDNPLTVNVMENVITTNASRRLLAVLGHAEGEAANRFPMNAVSADIPLSTLGAASPRLLKALADFRG
jgi:hypothetical protein